MDYAIGPNYWRSLNPDDPLRQGELALTTDDIESAVIDHAAGVARDRTDDERLAAQIAAARSAIKPVNATQIRIALNQAGLRDMVEAAVSAGSQELKDWWEFSVNLYRDHPLVVGMVTALGIPPDQADALWVAAAGIE